MTGCGCALLLCCVRAEDGARCGKIWQAKNVNMMCMLFMLCYIGGKSVQKTALDVAELTKHVNVGGKREALLGSSDAAEEADRVRRGGRETRAGEITSVTVYALSILLTLIYLSCPT